MCHCHDIKLELCVLTNEPFLQACNLPNFIPVKDDVDSSPSSAETLMLPGRGEEEPSPQEPVLHDSEAPLKSSHLDVTATSEKGQGAAPSAAESRNMPEREHAGLVQHHFILNLK